MKIQQIQPNTSFEAKRRFLNENQMADVKALAEVEKEYSKKRGKKSWSD